MSNELGTGGQEGSRSRVNSILRGLKKSWNLVFCTFGQFWILSSRIVVSRKLRKSKKLQTKLKSKFMVTKILVIKGSNQASADEPRPRVYLLPPVIPLSSSKMWTLNSPGWIDSGFEFIFKKISSRQHFENFGNIFKFFRRFKIRNFY